jgi:uncharacterized protein
MEKKINKTKIIKDLSAALNAHKEMLFAIVHGSFVYIENFNDIDVAIYVNERLDSVLQYELNLEAELIMSGLFPKEIDIRVINKAPLYFQYNVIKNGNLLFSKNYDKYAEFKELIIRDYFDFQPYYKEYLKETINLEI